MTTTARASTLTCLTLTLLLPVASPAEPAADVAAAGWAVRQRSDRAGEMYTLYDRPRAGSDYLEYRMEVPVDAQPEDVMAALEHNLLDSATWPENFERTILRREERVIVSHDYIRVPFLSDRDVVVRTEIGRDAETGFPVMRWFSIAGEGPAPADGVVRMPSSTGSWTLQPDVGGRTLAVYESHVELGGSLPTAFVEARIPREIAQQARELRQTMREREVAQR